METEEEKKIRQTFLPILNPLGGTVNIVLWDLKVRLQENGTAATTAENWLSPWEIATIF
jgi:hypothetical protein